MTMTVDQPKVVDYRWRPGTHVKVNPGMASLEFDAARVENHGRLTPDVVVKRAEPEGSILHDEFIWDDPTAAAIQRVQRASNLIKSLVPIERKSDPMLLEEVKALRKIPAYIRIKPDADLPAISEFAQVVVERGNYVPIDQVMAHSETRRMLLRQAWRELKSIRDRYLELSELAEVWEEIEAARAKIFA